MLRSLCLSDKPDHLVHGVREPHGLAYHARSLAKRDKARVGEILCRSTRIIKGAVACGPVAAYKHGTPKATHASPDASCVQVAAGRVLRGKVWREQYQPGYIAWMTGCRQRRHNASALGAGEKHAAVVDELEAPHGVRGGLDVLKGPGYL